MEYQKLLLGDEPYFISYIKTSYHRHCHNEIEVIYCVSGEITVIVEDKEYHLKSNCALFVDSLAMHSLIIEGDGAILDIEFGARFLGNYFHEYSSYMFIEPLVLPEDDTGASKHIIKLLQKLFKEYIGPDTASLWLIKGYLNELFALMIRYLPKNQTKDAKRQRNIERYTKIQKVFDFVSVNYREQISVNDAAKIVGYDPNAFCRVFKEITGMSFHQYLNFFRINLAMNLLEYRSYSIGEVGEMVGVPVAKTFGRVFKSQTGMSPREYRYKIFGNKQVE